MRALIKAHGPENEPWQQFYRDLLKLFMKIFYICRYATLWFISEALYFFSKVQKVMSFL